MDNINTTYKDITTTFVLNTILHHVSMLWIFENHEQLQYDMEIQNSDWMAGGPWYNTYICKKLHGKHFEGSIINARTDSYNSMCSRDAYEK